MASADSPSGSPPSPPSSSGAASSPDSPPTQDSPPPPTSKSSPPPPSDSSNSPPPPSDSSNSPPPANSPPPPKSPASPPPPSKSPPSPPSPPPDSSSPPSPPGSSEAPSPTPSDDSPVAPPPPPPPPSPPSPPGVPNPPAALSPPPPPHHKTPSKTPSSSGSSNSNNSSSSGLSTTAIAGIAVAGAVAAVVLIALLYCCCCRRKRKRQHHYEEGPYYGGPPPAPHKDDYYAQYAHHNPLSEVNNYVKNPPPGPPPNNSGGSQLERLPSSTSFPGSLPPPPPPPPFSSGEDSSNFTGRRPPSPSLGIGPSRTTFTYEQLAQATNGFSQTNLLGQGGFGYVYKGVLTGGQLIAVKQLKSGGGQGEREFQAEVEIISRVHHRHLVSLIGYCIAGKQRILVYEFVANDTLEHHLHSKDEPTMDWSTRVKIAIGAARGLTYLHEDCYPKIIHRDIKSSNILLDSHYEAKVADFGLAKIASEGFTHVSTRVMGTFGYLAPEYASSGKLTDKSDVFSFGVVLLELITGRRPVDVNQSYAEDSLVDWARPLLIRAMEEVNPGPLVDPRLGNEYNQSEMMRMIGCAAVAIRHSARRRPRMGQIVRIMEGDVTLDDLNDGLRAGQSTIYSSLGDSDYDASQYNDDLKKHMKLAYGTRGYTSEFSGPASEYGTNASESSTEYHHSKEVDVTGGNANIPHPPGRGSHSSGVDIGKGREFV